MKTISKTDKSTNTPCSFRWQNYAEAHGADALLHLRISHLPTEEFRDGIWRNLLVHGSCGIVSSRGGGIAIGVTSMRNIAIRVTASRCTGIGITSNSKLVTRRRIISRISRTPCEYNGVQGILWDVTNISIQISPYCKVPLDITNGHNYHCNISPGLFHIRDLQTPIFSDEVSESAETFGVVVSLREFDFPSNGALQLFSNTTNEFAVQRKPTHPLMGWQQIQISGNFPFPCRCHPRNSSSFLNMNYVYVTNFNKI